MNPLALWAAAKALASPILGPVGALLRRVPPWAWALAAVLAWGVWHRHQAIAARAEFEHAKAVAAAERAQADAAAAAETARRLKTMQEVTDAATFQAQRDRAAAVAADAARNRLQQRVAAVQAGARAADPATAGGCQAALEAGDLLADVLRRADERAGQLAAYADAARTAGEACERAYYSLTERQP